MKQNTDKSQKPLVSVVIVSWNRKTDLEFVLNKLDEQEYRPLEIIVVDNMSEDGTREMLKAERPDVRLIELEKNIGVTAYNIGAGKANGEFVVFLDDDSYPGRYAVGDMVRAFLADEKTGIVAFDFRNHNSIDAHTDCPAEDVLGTAIEAYSFSGGGAGIRREIFDVENGYPEEFFIYWNELDFLLRVMNRGYRVLHYAGIPSYHMTSQVSRSSRNVAYYHVRNLVWIYAKFFPADVAFDNLKALLALSIYKSVSEKDAVYVRAWRDALRNITGPLEKRIVVKPEILDRVRISHSLAFTPVREPSRKVDDNAIDALKMKRCLIIRSSSLQHIARLPGILDRYSPGIKIDVLTHTHATRSMSLIRGLDKIIEYPDEGDFNRRCCDAVKELLDTNISDYAVVIPFAASDTTGYENVIEFALQLGAKQIIYNNSRGSLQYESRADAKKRVAKAEALRAIATETAEAAAPIINMLLARSGFE